MSTVNRLLICAFAFCVAVKSDLLPSYGYVEVPPSEDIKYNEQLDVFIGQDVGKSKIANPMLQSMNTEATVKS